MTYRINPKEIEAVLRLSQKQRLDHFIKRVSDWEEVWSLKADSGWVMAETSEGQIATPFWPHPDYAKLCTVGAWQGTEPGLIELAAFLARWLPGLDRDNRLVEIFRSPGQNGAVLKPCDLQNRIMAHCRDNYGDNL